MKNLFPTKIPFLLFSLCVFFSGNLSAQQEKKRNSSQKKGPLLAHIVIQVSDIEKSAAFYQEFLNMEIIEKAENEGEIRYFLSNTDSHHKIVLKKTNNLPASEKRVLQQIAFEVPDHRSLLSFYEKVKKDQDPDLKNNQISWSIYFNDPDQNEIEVFWDVRDQAFGKSKWNGIVEDLPVKALRKGKL